DHYGRTVPKPAHGSVKLEGYTSSSRKILQAVVELYQKIVQHNLFIRRVTATANHVLPEEQVQKAEPKEEQLALFTDYAVDGQKQAAEREADRREKSLQHTMIAIKEKFGKNAILKGSNLRKEGTTIARNDQIGGHKA
ncbi:MAG: DNA methylase, partial [Selenomonas sp.]|nr:DNA methylase [Selenomonas sp.]